MQLVYKNLCLQPAIISDIDLLNRIYSDAAYEYKNIRNYKLITPMTYLTFGELPPNGDRNYFELFSIIENSFIIGYLTLYIGYPTEDDLVITYMYISEEHRNKGYGSIIIDRLCEYYSKSDYKTIRAIIPMISDKIEDFWISNSFTKVEEEEECGYFNESTVKRVEYIRKI